MYIPVKRNMNVKGQRAKGKPDWNGDNTGLGLMTRQVNYTHTTKNMK